MTSISRRRFLQTSAAATVSASVLGASLRPACANPDDAPAPRTPNLVFIFPDQFRPQALGFRGEDPVKTPNLDRFAGQSLVLDQTVSNTPICSPFRAMLMTGNYYTKTNVPTNCVTGGRYASELRQSDTCFTDVLHAAGYHQAYFGKWHLEHPRPPYVPSGNNNPSKNRCWEEWTPPERRHGVDLWHAYNTWDDHFHPHYWTNTSTRDNRLEVDNWSPIHEADMAIRYLENADGRMRDANRPFACFVSMNPPHTPYSYVPQRFKDVYRDAAFEDLCNRPSVRPGSPGEKIARAALADYFACVTGVDDQFGRIVSALDRLDLADDTVVVFCSDHGNCLGCHDHPTKGVIHEESFRIPMMIRQPGRIRPRTDGLLLSAPDIYPSVTGLMGLADHRPPAQGVDYSSLFTEGPHKRTPERPTSAVFAMQPSGRGDGPPRKNDEMPDGRRGVRTDRYTLELNKNAEGQITSTLLFDNQQDPFQLCNVAADRPELVKRLVDEELTPWLRKIEDPWLANAGGS